MAGAAKSAPSLCRRDGCCAPVRSRGLCQKHYHNFQATSPTFNMTQRTRDGIFGNLPATQLQITNATGFTSQTISRAIRRLRIDNEIHIGKFNSPGGAGEHFMPVFVKGPGVDAVLSKSRRAQQTKRARAKAHRSSYERIKLKKKTMSLVPIYGWAATLMVGVVP